jgi:hypothetical protein
MAPAHAAVLVWLLQPAAAHGAYGTTRPTECALSEGFRTANAWERAKEPNLRRYCDLLASGTSKLVGSGSAVLVKEVPQIADEADKLLPNRASSAVLKGRAFLRLGRAEDALAALVEAKRRDERALDDPVALLAWARANARTHHLAEAALAYRAALPRTSALSAPRVVDALTVAGLPEEKEALVAIAAEVVDVAAARDAWRAYLDGSGGKGVWADHARAHLGAGAAPVAKPQHPVRPPGGPR